MVHFIVIDFPNKDCVSLNYFNLQGKEDNIPGRVVEILESVSDIRFDGIEGFVRPYSIVRLDIHKERNSTECLLV
jgi:hypothetical protein